jgi:hypothetical protein
VTKTEAADGGLAERAMAGRLLPASHIRRYTWCFEAPPKRLPAKEMRLSPSPRIPLLRA